MQQLIDTTESLKQYTLELREVLTQQIIIVDDETMSKSGDQVKMLNGLKKRVDQEEKSYTKNLRDVIKKIQMQFKPFKEQIDNKITEIKQQQTMFLKEKQEKEKREAEKRKAEFDNKIIEQAEKMESLGMNEAAESLINKAVEIEAKPEKVRATGNVSTTTLRRTVGYVVTDESKVDRSLMSIDDKKIKALIKDLRDKFTNEGKAKGLAGVKLSDYVFEQFKNGEIKGIKLQIKEAAVSR